MIDLASVESLIEQYSMHDWTPRRILLRADEFMSISAKLMAILTDVEVRLSQIDAIWFSRSNKDAESWELRRLGGLPYALVRVVPKTASAEERDDILSETEIEIEIARRSTIEH